MYEYILHNSENNEIKTIRKSHFSPAEWQGLQCLACDISGDMCGEQSLMQRGIAPGGEEGELFANTDTKCRMHFQKYIEICIKSFL